MSDPGETDFGALLLFDTDAPEFARGFEAGILWGRMAHEYHVDQLVHPGNAEMVIRMAEARGWSFIGDEVDDHWVRIQLDRGGESP